MISNPRCHAPRRFDLVILDVDGTLLDSTGELRPRVVRAVRRVLESGCQVTLATGRRFRGTRPLAESLGLTFPLILHGGALIVAPDSGTILRANHLPQPAAGRAIRALTQAGRQPIIYGNGFGAEHVYVGPAERDDAYVRRYLRVAESVTRLDDAALTRVRDPLGIGVMGESDDLETAARLVQRIPGCRSFVTALQRLNCHLLEVVNASCSKAAAVEWLCREYQIDRAAVLAIGDHMNDLEMIQVAGFGVAMGDAPPRVRAAADALTGTADEDGVAGALERYVLGTDGGPWTVDRGSSTGDS